jgi:hypothetical protein
LRFSNFQHESESDVSEREDREGAPNEATQSPLRQFRKRRRRPGDVPESSDEGDKPWSESASRNALPAGTNEVGDTSRAMTKTVEGAVDKVGDTATEVTSGGEGNGDGDDKPLKMRLDLHLDVDVELEARVRGDLILGLH